jgi:transcription initiation factor TFIIIB Brf1 subunit/transcription initiation factor TFIIB
LIDAAPIPCPESGFACPGCDEKELLTYRIKADEYVCGVCGLVSTVNEVVEHGRELRNQQVKKENEAFNWLDDYTLRDTRQGAD